MEELDQLTKRDYLKLAGASLGALALATGGLLISNNKPAATDKPGTTPDVTPPGPGGGSGGIGGGGGPGGDGGSGGVGGGGGGGPGGDGGSGGVDGGNGGPGGDGSSGGVDGGPGGDGGAGGVDDPGDGGSGGVGDPGDGGSPGHGGPGGYVSGDYLDYERDDNGDIEFYWDGIEFETSNGDLDLEFVVSTPDYYIDLEVHDAGDGLEVTIESRTDYMDLEVDYDDVEFESDGAGYKFEDDDGEIEYRGVYTSLEWDPENRELDVKGLFKLDYDGDDLDLEFRGIGVKLEWESDGDFEARLL
ncbi:hypothetical protein [Haloarchaeobius amylolyticus]|uniref:hypothetical protein n=1 Tax=Haloarchaeobius amylolyticus TaxID=1198296 RepID=UPI002270D663|nr:hypothetical protein [Haloarchaeobius amylolyticus]